MHYRSFFWPVLLLGAGVIWLLINMNIISTENLMILYDLWPILLIIAGLDVLFARKLAFIGALLALLLIAAVIYVLIYGSPFVLPSVAGLLGQLLA
jgi:hypothetical protein